MAITKDTAHPAHPHPEPAAGDLEHVSTIVARTTPEPPPAYVLRGAGLFETYREELRYLGAGRWLVPSGSESGKVYEARVGTRPERNRCECTGHQRHGHCSHVVCAGIAHKKSALCDCCGERRWWSGLTEVQEDDSLLAWFPGDRLCDGCRPGHWA